MANSGEFFLSFRGKARIFLVSESAQVVRLLPLEPFLLPVNTLMDFDPVVLLRRRGGEGVGGRDAGHVGVGAVHDGGEL